MPAVPPGAPPGSYFDNNGILRNSKTTPLNQDGSPTGVQSSGLLPISRDPNGNPVPNDTATGPRADMNKYLMGGSTTWAPTEEARLQMMANGQVAQSARNDASMQGSQEQSGNAIAAQMGQAGALGGISSTLAGNAAQQGAGMGLQGQAGQGLLALGRAPAGPSAAESAMRANNDQAIQGQQSIAAGVRGGNSGLALSNAANNSAQLGGNLNQQVATQRASEDMANKNFSANALTGAANVFGNQTGQQTSTLGAAGQVGGAAGSVYGNAAGNSTANANTSAGMVNADTGYAMGYGNNADNIVQGQTSDLMQGDQNNLNAYNQIQATTMGNADKTGRGTITGSGGGDKALSMGVSALGSGLAMLSDVRAKSDVKRADDKISDGFRAAADSAASQIRGADVSYPSTGQDQYGYSQPYAGAPPGMDPRSDFDPYDSRSYEPTPAPPRSAMGGLYPVKPDYMKQDYGALAQDIPRGNPFTVPGVDPGLVRSNPFAVSDVRAKKNIRDAGPQISGAFRTAANDAAFLKDSPVAYPEGFAPRGAPVAPTPMDFDPYDGGSFVSNEDKFAAIDRAAAIRAKRPETHMEFSGGEFRDPLEQMRYTRELAGTGQGYPVTPGYQYAYKDPNSPGARPGPQYGIMAQDLEKTPAGASVVGEDKKGRKFVDPGRLSLMTAAEVAKQRRELDALKRTDFGGVQPAMYPGAEDYGY